MNKHRRRVNERREKSNQHAHLTIISRKTTSKQNMNKKKTSTCVIFLKNRTRRRQMTNLTSIKRHGENQLILMLTWNGDKWSYKMRCFSKKRLVICLILVEREREGRRERLDSINYANRLSSLSLSLIPSSSSWWSPSLFCSFLTRRADKQITRRRRRRGRKRQKKFCGRSLTKTSIEQEMRT